MSLLDKKKNVSGGAMISRVSRQQRGQFCANGAVTSVPIGSGNGQSGVPPKIILFRVTRSIWSSTSFQPLLLAKRKAPQISGH